MIRPTPIKGAAIYMKSANRSATSIPAGTSIIYHLVEAAMTKAIPVRPPMKKETICDSSRAVITGESPLLVQ